MKKHLRFLLLLLCFVFELNGQTTLQLQKEYQTIVSAREAPKIPDKEKLYAAYLSLCAICRDSTEARRRLHEYEALKNGDKALFQNAKEKRSIELYQEYLRTCFYCEDSVAAQRWIGYQHIDIKKGDSTAWTKYDRIGNSESYQKYLEEYPEGRFRKQALKKMNTLGRVEVWRPEMIAVKGGKFTMGAVPIETPEGVIDIQKEGNEKAHEVRVKDFWMDKYEMSFDIYDLYCEDTGQKSPSDNGWGRRSRPVIGVSWYDAAMFCNWLSEKHKLTPYYSIRQLNDVEYEVLIPNPAAKGYRLPTEAEWEYVAKTSTNAMLFANGRNYADPAEMNFACTKIDPGYEKMVRKSVSCPNTTLPVNHFLPNVLGYYNLSGNVAEWCWDGYDPDYKRTTQKDLEINPQGDPSNILKMYKGGSWIQAAFECRSTARKYLGAPNKRTFIGFRLVRNI